MQVKFNLRSFEMTIKLVAIDIDDTLLSSQHQLLASTK
ncbi:cof-like hydrolase family protein [Latilactobacillus curvatus]|nr:cof-like hydrolase family protein [Latilactobacillus curvatus]